MNKSKIEIYKKEDGQWAILFDEHEIVHDPWDGDYEADAYEVLFDSFENLKNYFAKIERH